MSLLDRVRAASRSFSELFKKDKPLEAPLTKQGAEFIRNEFLPNKIESQPRDKGKSLQAPVTPEAMSFLRQEFLPKASQTELSKEAVIGGRSTAEKAFTLAQLSRIKSQTGSLPTGVEDVQRQLGGEIGTGLIPFAGIEAKGAKSLQTAAKERGFISSVKGEFSPALKIEGQYIPRSTDELSIKARTLVMDNISQAEKIAMEGSDDTAVAVGTELIKRYRELADVATDKASKDLIYDKVSEVAQVMAKNLTAHGKAVQAASILSKQTPEGMIRFAASEINKYNRNVSKSLGGLFGLRKKIPNITAEQSQFIVDEMKAIQAIPEGTQRAMALQKFEDKVSQWIPSTLFEKINAVWRAGLLTGLKTTGLNTASNLSHAASEIIKDVPAAGVDSIVSLFTKQRTITPGVSGFRKGFKEGLDKGARYFKTGFDERNIAAKLDYRKVNFGSSRIAQALQAYEEGVFRAIGAQDQPFYYGAKARSLYNQGAVAAKNAGVKGTAKKEFIDAFISSPTDEALINATNDAEVAVFQNLTALGKVARAGQKMPGGMFVIPFGRTPASVATQMFNYTPVGAAKTVIENIGKGRFDQRAFSQGIGRGITGTAVLAIGAELAKKGLVALDYPNTEAEREQWKIEGKKANSVKIGDKWRSVAVFGPPGMVILIGANIQQAFEETGSHTEALAQGAFGSLKSLTEQTFLQGVNQFVSAIKDPERYGESLVGNLTSSFVPTLISDVARATDPLERRTDGIVDRVKARVPGLRRTLEPQVDVLGQRRERVGNFFEVMADPSRPSPVADSPESNELKRLWDSGFAATPTLLGDKDGYASLTPQENTALLIDAGGLFKDRLGKLIQTEAYQQLADDEKKDKVEDFADKAKIRARAIAVYEKVQGQSEKEKKKLLSLFKEDELMTRQVFNEYQKLVANPSLIEQTPDRPTYKEGESVDENKFLDDVIVYAEAVGVDPITAFNRILTGQRIRRLDSGAIIVERMDFSDSEAIRDSLGATEQYRLDHTIPLQLGGTNAKRNLELVPIETWAEYTPVENYLGRLLRNGDITKRQAQSTIKDFKKGRVTFDEITEKFNN